MEDFERAFVTEERWINSSIWKAIELWEKIPGFENYSVSTHGRVRNDKYGRILKTKKQNGYLRVGLSDYPEYKVFLVHVLVAKAFVPNPDNKPEVNHKNGIKDDNFFANLEWVTRKENMIHAYTELENNLIKPKQVYCEETQQTFWSGREAARELKISQTLISLCCNGKLKQTNGLHFKFV